MALFLKILPMLLKLQDVNEAVKDKYPDGKPFWYAKRFWGSLLTVVFGILGAMSINLPLNVDDTATQIVNLVSIGSTAVGTAYGMAMTVKGVVDANKRAAADPGK